MPIQQQNQPGLAIATQPATSTTTHYVTSSGTGGGGGAGTTVADSSGTNAASTSTANSTGTGAGTTINPALPGASGTGGNTGTSSSSGTTSLAVDLTNTAGATQTFAAFLNDAWMADPNLNINALVQAVLRNSYQDNQSDLKDYALKVEFYNNLKKNIRKEIASARSFQSSNATTNGNAAFPGGATYQASPTGSDTYNGSAQVNQNEGNNWGSSGTSPGNGMSPTGTISNANDLNSYISTMEEYLTSVGDDAQLAQVDLQNMAQNQQQTLQTLSNLSKSFNDVSMAIIRNIQG